MSLGLPVHLVPHHVRRASSKAAHLVALVCILLAGFGVLALQAELPGRVIWPALIALAVMLVMLWRLDRHRTHFYSGAYLLVGGACVYWVGIVAMSEFPGTNLSNTFILSLSKVALIMVGGPGIRTYSAIAWSFAGILTAGIATLVAVLQVGSRFVPDLTAITAFVLIVGFQLGLGLNRFRIRSAQPSLHRAARDEHLSAMRSRIEVKAAAVLHDTVLNHLAAVANARPGQLDPTLGDQIDRDLEVIVGGDWLIDGNVPTSPQSNVDWRNSRLFQVVEEARELGLEIDVSGEVGSASRLSVEQATAVALATKQCLVNVVKHAGTKRAEVVVYGSEGEVSVMVIDAGKGFSEAETGADRLGLKHSVRRRIESVGGTVQLWSTPGRGTSVLIRVPAPKPADPQDAVAR